MRFTRRLVTTLVGAGLLGLPVLAMGAAPATAAAPVATRITSAKICAVFPSGCYSNDAGTLTRQQYGRTLRISGKLETAGAGKTVALQRRAAGTTAWTATAASATTGTGGAFTIPIAASTNASYRVVFAGNASYSPSTSAVVGAKVARKLGARKEQISGPKFRFYGKVSPQYARQKIVLQKKVGTGIWRTIAAKNTTATSRWSFTVYAKSSPGVVYYRTFTPKSVKFIKSYSSEFKLRTL